ncbi:MAG: alpha/beta hydrolase [Gemmatimonadales bacterium]
MLPAPLPDRSEVPRRAAGARRLALVVAAGVLGGLLVGLGPRPRVEGRWVEPAVPAEPDAWLSGRESGVSDLEPDEAKAIVWADSATRGRTPVALAYLHGFSADRHEVEPLVADVARDLGANVYYARLTGHALDGEALAQATADDWLADAAEAVAVAASIGERLVLIGTSTGGSLALWAATRPEAAGRVAALVLVSPNLGLRDRRAEMLLWPWGGLLARLIEGPERCFTPRTEAEARHWTTCYPTRALLPMMALVDLARALEPTDLRVPTLVLYSERDEIVDPAATVRFFAQVDGAAVRTRVVNDSGDPAHHVLAGDIMSPATTARVRDEILRFLDATLR